MPTPAAGSLASGCAALGVKSVPAGVRATHEAHPAGLTRREQRCSSWSAEGLTNDEIAGRLFLSAKTVDHHVSAVLAKLGVPSRRRLPRRPHGWAWSPRPDVRPART